MSGFRCVVRVLATLFALLAIAQTIPTATHAQTTTPHIDHRPPAPRPYLNCTNPPCLNPPPVIGVFSSASLGSGVNGNPMPTTDTMPTLGVYIYICGAAGGTDTAAFNGTTNIPLQSEVGWCTPNGAFGFDNGNGSGINYTLTVGTNNFYVWACSATNSGNTGQCTSSSYNVTHPAMAVTPKGAPVNMSPGLTGVSQTFYVHNYTAASMTDTLTLTCSGTAVSNCQKTQTAITVAPNTPLAVVVTYNSGTTLNATGTVQLKAKSGSYADSGSVNVTIAYYQAIAINTKFMNQDDQDMSRCAANCFAATAQLSTIPYFSRDGQRNVTLVYHGDRVAVRPYLITDVTQDTNLYSLKNLAYSAQYQVNGTWLNVTFTNGRQTLYYDGSPFQYGIGEPFRLTGLTDMSTVANAAWAAAPLKVTVTATYVDGHTETHVDSSTLSVVSELKSPIARGWSVLGVPHLYGRSDNSATQMVVREGEGSTTMYNGSCSPNCVWLPTGHGVFSRIDLNSGDSIGYVRSWPDSTREKFYTSGVKVGNIAMRIDRMNDTIVYGYDTQGRLHTISDPYRTVSGGGHAVITLNYNTYGLASIVEPATAGGRTTTVTLNPDSTLHSWMDPDSVTRTFTYDSQRRLLSYTDRKGYATTFQYDTLDWKINQITQATVPIDTGANGTTVSYPLVTRYTHWQRVGVPTDSATLTNLAFPVSATLGIWGMTSMATHDTADNAWTQFVPDRWGQPTEEFDVNSLETTFSRDSNGLDTATTYPTGGVDHFAYINNLLFFSQPAGQSYRTYYHYGAFALPDSIYSPGQATVYNYFTVANRGRIDSTRVGFNSPVTANTFDNLYRLTKSVDPVGHTKMVGYDATTGNTSSVTASPSGRATQTTYDATGRQSRIAVTGPSGTQTTTYYYDKMNRVVGMQDGVHADTLVYTYDPVYLTKTTDLKRQAYQATYNAMGWPLTLQDPAGNTITTTYNRLGLKATVRNRRNQLMSYHYDKLGRLTAVHRPSVNNEADANDTLYYAANGDIVTDSNAVVRNRSYLSDAYGWVDSTITFFVPHGYYWKRYYHHNARGQIDSISFFSNSPGVRPPTRHFGWDALTGLLDSLWAGSGYVTHLGYNAALRSDTTKYPNGVTRIDSLSDVGLLSSGYSSNVSAKFNRTYGYDSAGHIAEIDFPDTTSELYNYDALSRLSAQYIGKWADTIPCWKIHGQQGYPCGQQSRFSATTDYGFAFDAAGNLDTVYDVIHATKTVGAFGTGNTDSLWNGVSLTHDADGDRMTNGSSTSYLWSADGRLLQVITGGNTTNYDYDVEGNLVRRSTPAGDDRYYLWDSGQLIAILDANAQNVTVEYGYYPGTNRLWAEGVPNLLSASFYEQDAAGNVIGLHNSAAAASQSLKYDPWGNLESLNVYSGTDTTQLRWKGMLWEGRSQLYNVRARWYDPVTRRFLSQDPLGLAGGINQYAFAAGDPLNGADPTGLLYYQENCSDPVMTAVTIIQGGDAGPVATTIWVPVSTCTYEEIPADDLPDGVYWGCRQLTSKLPLANALAGHCALQSVEGDDINMYQLIPDGRHATFPDATPEDSLFNWILVPGTNLQSAYALDGSVDVYEEWWAQNVPYPFFGIPYLGGQNSNTFACGLARYAGISVPSSLWTGNSPLAKRQYPGLPLAGGCSPSPSP